MNYVILLIAVEQPQTILALQESRAKVANKIIEEYGDTDTVKGDISTLDQTVLSGKYSNLTLTA